VKEILEQAIADTGISRITDYGLQLANFRFQISVSVLTVDS